MNTKSLSIKYNPEEVENKWYSYWLANNYFQSKPNDQTPYTILIPPPNVTGCLHIGHVLNNTLQDILIRKARMSGFNACWIPGIDHASIATEAKVVNLLKEKNISKFDIGREKFLEHAWNWTYKHKDIILEQLKKLGCSCDWSRTKFTLDKDFSNSIIKLFVKLYNENKIYRGNKMINWDPQAKTNISDEEVIHIEKRGKLYFLKYFIENSDKYVVITTTRPETIFGDTAVCFHPKDERYINLKGKKLVIPIVNRCIPVIYDDCVDKEFGTGSLKVTPASDINDYELGKKHQLLSIEIFNEDATLNECGLHYHGKDRFIVRKEIEQELIEKNLLEKIENYTNKVGISERTGVIVEPRISVQWFLKMQEIAKPALDVVMKEELKFFPSNYKNIYKHWMKNIHDWNISRQLWWGHQIPAFYFGENLNDFVVADTIENALHLAKEKSGNLSLTIEELRQDNDVLDTWFSSWIWPISVFDGINNPNNEEIQYYYPTQDLITGPDIIFFWVARMIIAGYLLRNEKPFNNVYFTGIVRDKLGRKMSKQLGNSPDPIKLMKKYGADGVRIGIIMSAPSGNNVKFDEKLFLQGRNFCNKLWNAFRLISNWEKQNNNSSQLEIEAIIWFENRLNQVLEEIENYYSKYRISDALLSIYKLIWDDFCSWYLEIIKPNFREKISCFAHLKTIKFLENLLKILHPFAPFITEEIWQSLKTRSVKQALIVSNYPKVKKFDNQNLNEFEFAKNFVSSIRNYRKQNQLSSKINLDLYVQTDNINYINTIEKLSYSQIYFSKKPSVRHFLVLVDQIEILIPQIKEQNICVDNKKLYQEIKYLKRFLNSINKKLSNEKFLSNAQIRVIELEKKKKLDIEEKIKILNNQLN